MASTTVKEWIKRNFLRSSTIERYFKVNKYTNFEEANLIYIFLRFYRESSCMIDVGAHHGESLEPYESIGWKIYAFEPDPENRKKISPSPGTELFDLAISDSDDKQLILYTSEQSTGISSLHPFHASHKRSVVVTTKTLSSFCKEKQIKSIDFLKIDTEGFDLFVLKGAPLDTIKPIMIMCEFEDSKTAGLGYSYRDMGNYLLEKKYKVFMSEWYPIESYGGIHQWRKIGEYYAGSKLEDPKAWGNFIAVRSGYYDAFRATLDKYLKYFRMHNKHSATPL
jgi:FkbM family methyltransferase